MWIGFRLSCDFQEACRESSYFLRKPFLVQVLALAAVSAGVAVATVSDLEFNLYGKMANPTHRYSGKMAKLKWLS